jgi:predicted 2-oxoglutarate/Fe(II)-dependent dioxygenase YbiX
MSFSYDFWLWDDPQLTVDEIKESNDKINKSYFATENKEMGAKVDGTYLKNIEPKQVYVGDLTRPIYNFTQKAIRTCHYKFGFSTFPLNIYDVALYNVYSSKIKGHYGAHTDSSRNDIFDTKMTLLINLSEGDYEDGDLIVNGKMTNFKKPGSAILFKSYLLHEVTPVTSGERISLAYFINGPKSN